MLKTIRYIWNHPLASLNKLGGVSRYVRWQLSSRIIGRPIVLSFVEESVLVVETSMTGATGNYYCGLHEFADMGFVLHFLRQDDLFVDVGANIGSYTVLASGVVGAESLAFEPVPPTFHRLVRNIQINSLQNLVVLKQLAVGQEQGEIRFSVDRDTVNAVVDESYSGVSEVVPVQCLDILLKDKNPAVWKVDVEGFEFQVLQGAKESIRNTSLQAILLEGQSEEIKSILLNAGFLKATYDPFTRNLAIHDSGTELRVQNQLWVRNADFVRERCLSSQKYLIKNLGLKI